MKKNKELTPFETLTFLSTGLFLVFVLLVPIILQLFISVDDYVKNSESVTLSSYHLVKSDDFFAIGFSRESELIVSQQTYYDVLYYHKKKNDLAWIDLSGDLEDKSLLVKINPEEFKKHKGTKSDPIPVFNVAIEEEQFEWDDKSYRHNIEEHIIYEDILHAASYNTFLIYWMCISVVLGMIAFFLHMNRENKRRKAEKEMKRNRHLL
ncbi:hypothetical protein [Streptococcus zalophi]|uniref:DUF8188 domain-containing protein n=1 Tax=Streptococcus zalophi TaxID=640031 RepID=A0A934PAL7_9STRE|nr:hypothetical protein [Streptococcus zalophi]MBJ8350029.1 hypothetical protein [Streptococcus zalophi]MCR8967035.1 hypothetical protein [Streptococcus zalophi]